MTTTLVGAPSAATPRHAGARLTLVLGLGLVGVACACIASLLIGSRMISPAVMVDLLQGTALATDPDVIIMQQARFPRTVAGIVVGVGFGVAGGLIQAFTRNPLADPGILGVNAGAAFAVALAVMVLGVGSPIGYVWFALAGALAATLAVYTVGRADPLTTVLAGVALGAVLAGLTSAITLLNRGVFDSVRFWNLGSLQNRSFDVIAVGTPLIVVGLVVTVYVTRHLDAIALGDDVARALGTPVGVVRAATIAAVTLLAGAATAIAGPVGFVGLIVPHLVRPLVGVNNGAVLAATAVLAPLLVLVSDIVGRVLTSGEMAVGIVTAFVGAPFVIWLARRSSLVDL